MTLHARVLGATAAAGLAAALALPAAAQTTTPPTNTTTMPSNSTMHCVNNGAKARTTVQPNAGSSQTTANGALPSGNANENMNGNANTSVTTNTNGTTTTTSTSGTSTGTTTTTSSNPAVNSGCANGATMPATTTTMPATGNGPNGTQMDALNNNPNGSDWLAKFNRQVPATTNTFGTMPHHKSKHHVKRASGGGGM